MVVNDTPSSAPAPTPPGPRRRSGRHGVVKGVGAVVLLLLVAIGVCEWLGWPFLRRPAEQWLSQKLDRQVRFDGPDGDAWTLRLIGHLRLSSDSLTIAGPSWSTMGGPTLQAQHASLTLRYSDLLAMREDGQPLRVKALRAGDIAMRLERDVEGRASWQFGKQPPSDTQVRKRPSVDGIRFDLLDVRNGTLLVDDKIQRLSLLGRFALRETWTTAEEAASAAASSSRVAVDFGERVAGKRPGASAASAPTGDPGPGESDRYGVTASAEGHFRDLPIKASLQTGSALPWLSSDPNAPAVPVTLRGNIGKAQLSFDGLVRDLLFSQGLSGQYSLSGPSLAAVGEPLGVTLPTTPAFAMQGKLTRDGSRWTTAVSKATIGKSHLSGEFEYNKPENALPTLTGELRGRELWLADLGPAVGVPAQPGERKEKKAASRVLPDKQFDLPSLRAMNANVNVKLARFESGTALLQAAEPLNARIVLQDGVLELRDIDARVARGQVAGRMLLDGRGPQAKWQARLRVGGVHLEQWLNLERKNGKRWVTGVMGGRVALDGVGRSTAELLASADGRMVLYWTDGTISHLIVEAAGIDIAQGLGLLVRGDDALQVNCGVADLRVKDGVVTPRPMVIDTRDSVVLVDGGMSLATERLALTAKVDPKDKSPLTLRTPLNIQGTMGDPQLSLQKGPLLRKLLPAAVLGVAVAPLAAIVPLIDLGEEPDAENLRALSECNARLAPTSKGRTGS